MYVKHLETGPGREGGLIPAWPDCSPPLLSIHSLSLRKISIHSLSLRNYCRTLPAHPHNTPHLQKNSCTLTSLSHFSKVKQALINYPAKSRRVLIPFPFPNPTVVHHNPSQPVLLPVCISTSSSPHHPAHL